MPSPKTALVALLPLVPQASAWGALGHNTVAYIAQQFLHKSTAHFAQSLLNDTSSNYLANIATWADSFRSTPEGAFSSPLHYIDAFDSPPESCNVDYERDCPEEGCIISALANYTARVQQQNVGFVERQRALKWIVHFTGDVHQPLHVENLEVGGNLINVTFDGVVANLHRIWDSNIPEKLRGGFALEDARIWAEELAGEIRNGTYAAVKEEWLEGIVASDAVETTMVWARDANAYICSTVVPEGPEAVRHQELGGEYYKKAIPVVQQQIAKAGFRLAAWLNTIVTGEDCLGGKKAKPFGNKGPTIKKELAGWMVKARETRRDFGYDCGCTEEHHH
ncbi:hypothetical protein BS50DRAFT_219575 [Corynespora cassiicola Philippines]|uniref:Nuclease PA3 n=1 Tax=Corynespora cassiicola Philippines TaxID=1448308 RepID=A0A2T2N2Z0_CORCC|nr:hypothetical protein BS50DRAFT_219575 [Corynespora cassiicola Philippines]